MGSRVSLGELEHDPVEALGAVPHRERREDTFPDELQLVAERRAQQRRRRLVFEGDECPQRVRCMFEVVRVPPTR